MGSATETFDALCGLCGVAVDRSSVMDFGGFALAFEQLFNGNVPLEPEAEPRKGASLALQLSSV